MEILGSVRNSSISIFPEHDINVRPQSQTLFLHPISINNTMALEVEWPNVPLKSNPYSRLRREVNIGAPGESVELPSYGFPVFTYGAIKYVLLKDVAKLWNFSSAYQVIAAIVKYSGVSKSVFLKLSDLELNERLLEAGLIRVSENARQLFYTQVEFLTSVVKNSEALGPNVQERTERRKFPVAREAEDDLLTVSLVFPQHGHVEETLPLTHATFLSLLPQTKLLVYKHEGYYRRVYGNNVSVQERELLLANQDYSNLEVSGQLSKFNNQSSDPTTRKALGKQKRVSMTQDPNALDVTENILPGCGLIQDFNIGAVCKVPNYFIASGQAGSSQLGTAHSKPHLEDLKLDYKDAPKTALPSSNMQTTSDVESLNSRYLYHKSYRGPGSGNYKDAALVSRINKLKVFPLATAPETNSVTHLSLSKVFKKARTANRSSRSMKGLMHEYFSKDNVDVSIHRQKISVDDHANIEMIHNATLFNVVANTYRDLSIDTWRCFYKFKEIDFEKLQNSELAKAKDAQRAKLLKEQEELTRMGLPHSAELEALLRPDPLERFTLPSDHKEFVERLPVELRGDDEDAESALSKPVRYVATYPDRNLPEVLNQIEMIKLPNANSLGWDNIRKYRDNHS